MGIPIEAEQPGVADIDLLDADVDLLDEDFVELGRIVVSNLQGEAERAVALTPAHRQSGSPRGTSSQGEVNAD